MIAGEGAVRWTEDGATQIRHTPDPTGLVRSLFADEQAEIRDLEVRPASLEATYLALVADAESAAPSDHPSAA